VEDNAAAAKLLLNLLVFILFITIIIKNANDYSDTVTSKMLQEHFTLSSSMQQAR